MIPFTHRKPNLPFVIIFLFVALAVMNVAAQEKYGDLTIGDKIRFNSKVLGEERKIVVIPPFNYKDRPGEKFPVVYVLDVGNNLFATFGILNFYSVVLKSLPPMIIVGIVSADREKDYLPSPSKECPTGGAAAKFLEFIHAELVPYIDSAYPAAAERTIVGHSAGGLFALYTLENKPELFDNYLCIDPSMWYEGQAYIKKIQGFFKTNGKIKKSLFLSLSNEPGMGNFAFIDALEKYAPAGFRWDYVHYKDETHNSLGFKSLCAGFEKLYKDRELPVDAPK